MANLKPAVQDIYNFKKLIHKGNKVWFQTFSKKDVKGHKPKAFYGFLTKEMKQQLEDANGAGMELGMMINQSNGQSRKAKDVIGVNAFSADFDRGDMTKEGLLELLPVEPYLMVNTSPGNFHVHWLISGCKPEQFTALMKALALKYGSDDKVCDLPHVMRAPGTINWKYELPFLTTIVHSKQNTKPIPLKVFIKKMGLKVDDVKPEIGNEDIALVKPMSEELQAEVVEALEHVSPENRAIWLKVMMAIHSVAPTEVGYIIFTKWSKQSDKYDEAEHQKIWSELKVGGGVTINSLFWLARVAKRSAGVKFDESSLAKLFAELCKNLLRYDPENKKWYWFNGVVWVADLQAPIRFAREMTLDLYEAQSEPSENIMKSFLTVSGFRSIVAHAELLPEIQIGPLDFDKNPNLLAVKNGVVDLTTGEFRQALAADFLCRQANVVFDADARCPLWLNYMKMVTCKDRQLYEFIRRVLGYILIGRANLQLFFWAFGTGRNGKGVMMRTVKALLGEYGIAVSPSLLTTAYSGNANAPSPALAILIGARFVICTETIGRKLDEAFVKQFAGGDEITARHGYGNVFTFKPEGKLFLSANYSNMPEIAANDDAMWGRLVPIPFNAKFTKGVDDDGDLDDKLALEFSGILNWLLKGAVIYSNEGLGSCKAVDDMKLKLRKDADSILAWMSECCVENSKSKTQASIAYDNYKTFMSNKVRKALSVQAFSAGLEQKNYFRKVTSKNNYYGGFSLRK